jgi:hypothetical protein
MIDDDIATRLRAELHTTQVPYDEALASRMIDNALGAAAGTDDRAPVTVLTQLMPDPAPGSRRRFTRFAVPVTAAAAVVAVASVSVALSSPRHHETSGQPRSAAAASPAQPLTWMTSHRPATAPPGGATSTSAPGPDRAEPAAGPLPPSHPVDLTWRFSVGTVPGYDISRVSITNTVQVADISASGQLKSIGDIHIFARGALDPGTLTSGTPVTVNGKAGYFGMFHVPSPYDAVDGGRPNQKPTLAWRYAEDAWALVSGDWGQSDSGGSYDLGVARAAEQSVANAVDTAHSSALTVDFTLGWLPAGLVVENGVNSNTVEGADPNHPTLQPVTQVGLSDGKQRDKRYPGEYWGSALTIGRQHTAVRPDDPKPNVTVDGKPGYYESGAGLTVRYPDGTELVIQVDPLHADTFSKADLVRIAQHASFAPSPDDVSTWVPAGQAVPH